MRKMWINKLIVLCIVCSFVLATPVFAMAKVDPNWAISSALYEIRTWEKDFLQPRSLAVLSDGRLLVADSANHQLKVLSVEKVITLGGIDVGTDQAGLPIGGYLDGPLPVVAFHKPAGLTVDTKGNVYIADMDNHAIRKLTPNGQVTTLAGAGSLGWTDGQGIEAKFYAPTDVAVDHTGNVYVADTLNHVIRKISVDGSVTTLTAPSARVIEYVPGAVSAVGDYHDGSIENAKFNEPSGLVIDEKGNLYVSDRGNQRIRYIDFEAGTVSTVAGGGTYTKQAPYVQGDFVDGPALQARFNAPEGLALTADGTLVVADGLNHVIRLVKDGQVTTIAGVPTEYGHTNGVARATQFHHPTDIAILPDGRLAIADEYGNQIRVLQPYTRPTGLSKDTISILLDGKRIQSESEFQNPGIVLLPVQTIGEMFGFEVNIEVGSTAAKLTREDTVYSIIAGSKYANIITDGREQQVVMNGKPTFIQDRLFAPIRFFATESNLDIQWDGTERNVVIRQLTFE